MLKLRELLDNREFRLKRGGIEEIIYILLQV
jgi:hypothetical protein